MKQTLPHWPRLMAGALAAAYLGISETTLREHGPEARHIGRRALWDRLDLDRYADSLAGQPLDKKERKAEGDDILRRVKMRLASG